MNRLGHRPWVGCLLLPGLALASLAYAHRTPAPAAPTLVVGSLTLHRCDTPAPWCGALVRALDPSGVVPGSVSVYFEYYPHTAPGAAEGTLVANEGGPGFPTTDSRAAYLALFEPLRGSYDVLLMDYRGTGRSGAVDCRALQRGALTEANVGACGDSLEARVSLYSTALGADDLAALLEALGVQRASVYGDSYGTYFSQVFTLRHPDKVRALVLDGAYPLEGGPDYPWYPHYAPAMREKFNRACERSAECSELPGSSLDHIAPALQALREKPLVAHVQVAPGRQMSFTADATALAILMFGSAPAYASVRELDAAARAFVAGDQLPLLRLMAETLGSVDSRDPSRSPERFSAGLAAAVSCGDPPQIFDMTLPVAQRLRARDELIARRRAEAPDTYAPFTLDEYRHMPLDYAFIDECVRWPARTPEWPSSTLVPDAPYPDLPVLVVSGDLDNMTSPADGAAAAARFPAAHHVVLANSFHVNALPHARSECGALLVRRFLAGLSTEEDSCAAAVPPVRLLARFARHASEVAPAQPLAGNEADTDELRIVNAALLTAQDALVRAEENGAGRGVGLRGGSIRVVDGTPGYHLTLHDARWTEDVAVSGELDWPGRTGSVHADLEVSAPQRVRGKLALGWPEGAAHARAHIEGRLGPHAVVAEAPAP